MNAVKITFFKILKSIKILKRNKLHEFRIFKNEGEYMSLKNRDFKYIGYVLLIVIFVPMVHLYGQTLTILGTLGGTNSQAMDVSSTGAVVGRSNFVEGSGAYRGFIWTESGGMIDLGSLGGNTSEANAISADGQVVVGVSQDEAFTSRAFRWTESLGMMILDDENWTLSEAVAVSDNGIIVGTGSNASNNQHAFTWTEPTGIQDLGTAPDASASRAIDISGDGSIIVVESGTADIWSTTTGWSSLSGAPNFIINAISSDGNTFVGYTTDAYFAYWSEETGLRTFSIPGSMSSYAYDVNEDGSIIVGSGRFFPNEFRAYRWTPESNFEDLNVVYNSLLGDSISLSDAIAISPNGRYIVGTALIIGETNYSRPYLLDVGIPNPTDESVNNLTNTLRLAQNYPNPFNPETTIEFSLPQNAYMTLEIFNIKGQKIKTLVNGKFSSGTHSIRWNGTDENGRVVANGTYIYRIYSDQFSVSRKMILLK